MLLVFCSLNFLVFGGSLRRYLFCISFNGFCYCGWQVQKNAVTVQSVFQNAFKRVVGFRGDVVSCSRTDSGVHANNFYFHMDLDLKLSLKNLQFALNNFLPDDIVVKNIKEVDKTFHARYQVKRKEYIYKVWLNKVKNPFLKGLVMNYSKAIDLKNILKAAKFFIGKQDFSSFCSSKTKVVDKVRTIYFLDVFLKDDFLIFKIVGDGFLHNMVRIMVGTLLEVSEGKIEPEEIKNIIKKKDRRYAGKTVVADGLYLNDVIY